MQNLISPNLEHTLGWTVVHSLWQATAIALITAIVMIALRNKTANLRYFVGCGAMLLTLLSSITTFFYEYQWSSTSGLSGELAQPNVVKALVLQATYANNTISGLGFQTYFAQHIPLIVTVWLMGVAIFILRLLGGLSYIAYLKRYRNQPIRGIWQGRVEWLCEAIGLNKAVELVESALVKTPMVIGALKPMILFPVGAIHFLSTDQVEAILAHELAPIRRKDYLINILQSLVEILFYFHPAVWWLSNTVRNERENCCDDIAVGVCGNSLSYAKALVSLQEWNMKAPTLAMGFAGTGKKEQLLHRVKRILQQPDHKANVVEKIAATCLLFGFVVFASFCQNKATGETSLTNNHTSWVTSIDTIPIGGGKKKITGTWTYTDDHDKITLQTENGITTKLNINGKDIPKEQFGQYESFIQQIHQESEQAREEAEQVGREAEQAGREAEEAGREAEQAAREASSAGEEAAREAQEAAKEAQQEAEEARKEAERDTNEAKQEAERDRKQGEIDHEQGERDRIQGEKDRIEGEKDRIKADKFNAEIHDQLIKDGLIQSSGSFSYSIKGDGEFIVNGKKQSVEIFQKYKAIFERAFGNSLKRGVSISRNESN